MRRVLARQLLSNITRAIGKRVHTRLDRVDGCVREWTHRAGNEADNHMLI